MEQYEIAVGRGVPLGGFRWSPSVGACDWDSLLADPAGRAAPVGVVGLGSRTTVFTDVWAAAAAGAPVADLPAYRFQPPCDEQLRGLLPQMSHWSWQDPPGDEVVPPLTLPQAPAAGA